MVHKTPELYQQAKLYRKRPKGGFIQLFQRMSSRNSDFQRLLTKLMPKLVARTLKLLKIINSKHPTPALSERKRQKSVLGQRILFYSFMNPVLELEKKEDTSQNLQPQIQGLYQLVVLLS